MCNVMTAAAPTVPLLHGLLWKRRVDEEGDAIQKVWHFASFSLWGRRNVNAKQFAFTSHFDSWGKKIYETFQSLECGEEAWNSCALPFPVSRKLLIEVRIRRGRRILQFRKQLSRDEATASANNNIICRRTFHRWFISVHTRCLSAGVPRFENFNLFVILITWWRLLSLSREMNGN